MKNILNKINSRVTVIFLLIAFQNAHAQIEFQPYGIENTSCIYRVNPSDIDGDGDMDFFAICFAEENRSITWYENLNGQGNFMVKNAMLTGEEAATILCPGDIDGDGDIDLLAASQGFMGENRKLFWYENLDGEGNFGDRQIIAINFNTSWSISLSDIDNDGDLDVVAAFVNDRISWFENISGQGDFTVEHVISNSIYRVFAIDVIDIDSDGDMDVLAAFEDDNEITWYENTSGTGIFGIKQIISTDIDTPYGIYGADLDNDGDMDVVSSSYHDGKIAWYENTNGIGDFSNQNIIHLGEFGVKDLAIEDLDSDGDLDVLSTSRIVGGASKVAWYENMNGSGNFGSQQVITIELDNPKSIHVVDIDGDLDKDIIFNAGFSYSNSATSYWFKNLSPVSLYPYTLSNFRIYPTLVRDYVTVESDSKIVSIEIYNTLGQLKLIESYPNQINVSGLIDGSYFCVLKDVNDNFGISKIVKNSK